MICRPSRSLLAGIAALSACLAAPVYGNEPDPAAKALAVKAEADLKRFESGDRSKVCETADDFTALAARGTVPASGGLSALFAGICAAQHRDYAGALIAFGRAEAATGQVANLRPLLPLIDGLSLDAAVRAKAWPEFTDHAVHMALRDSAPEFADISPDMVNFALFRLAPADRDRVASAFGSATNFAALNSDVRNMFAMAAIEPALRIGDLAFATRMAATVSYPPSQRGMLINRTYEPLWPALAKTVGPQMRASRDAYAADRAAAFRAAPADVQLGADAILAAAYAGQFERAVELGREMKLNLAGLADYDLPHAWAVNNLAWALDHLGRSSEADRWFDGLAALPLENRRWMVNFAINRAERLLYAHRWAEALAAGTYAVKVAATQGSPYAVQSAGVLRTCAAAQLGRAAEVAEAWPALRAHAMDNVGGTAGLARCAGKSDEARAILKEALADQEKRADALITIQPAGADLMGDPVFPGGGNFALLGADAELRAAFDRVGRILPDELLPTPPGR